METRALFYDGLLKIRKQCGFFHMSFFPFFIFPALVYASGSFAGKRGPTEQIIASCDRQAASKRERGGSTGQEPERSGI